MQFSKRADNVFACAERAVVHVINPYEPKAQHQVIELRPEDAIAVDEQDTKKARTENQNQNKNWYITGLCFSEDASKLYVGKCSLAPPGLDRNPTHSAQ